MRTVLFVPGFQEDIKSRDYIKVLKAFESKGYKAVFVTIQWERTTIDEWTSEFENTYGKYDSKNTVLAGFSFGAVTALVAASKRAPSELWLFSLSSYFAEDKPRPSWLKSIGKRRSEKFRQISFNKLASTIKCKTLVFIGEAEAKNYPEMSERAQEAQKNLPDSVFIKVQQSPHDVTNKNYLEAIKKNI